MVVQCGGQAWVFLWISVLSLRFLLRVLHFWTTGLSHAYLSACGFYAFGKLSINGLSPNLLETYPGLKGSVVLSLFEIDCGVLDGIITSSSPSCHVLWHDGGVDIIPVVVIYLKLNKPLQFTLLRKAKPHLLNLICSSCWSSIGRQGGKQYISIGSRCGFVGIVSHEIGKWKT